MKHSLEPLRVSMLSNMEGGQLMKRHLDDLRNLSPVLLTDAPFNAYLRDLAGFAEKYQKGLAQVRKNEETEKIVLADDLRDKALEAFGRALQLYSVSDLPDEVEASRVLRILYDTFPNLSRLNYEAETIGIDKLVGELNGPNYAAKVSFLHIERWVTRISNANEVFKKLFGGRMTTTALTEVYDLKSIRIEMFRKYSDFCDYVLAMAKAHDTPLFLTTLDLLNTARKYYADLLARRNASPPTDASNPAV